ncbi:transcription factor MAMYB [Actinidia eriantha]|uniref:transcription factor MAMYB n=1 Tax=Actinidia eriantha TaxID=165200 RepID=UPI00258C40DD|nr:transcription factor MAMYB [Actinidia eriantha]
MEFLDEETRPRFLFQSRSKPPPNPETQTPDLHKPSLFISFSLSTVLFALSLLFPQPEPLQSLLLWLALSLLLGPLAPSSLTGGDIRVGAGKALDPPPENAAADLDDLKKKTPNRRSRARKLEELGLNSDPIPTVVERPEKVENSRNSTQFKGNFSEESVIEGGEREWSEGDVEMLKKLLVKHPVGKPRRWEAIAEAFQGRHGVESVIKTAKSMSEKKMSGEDSFARFLKDRKPVDKRADDGGDGGGMVEEGREEVMKENGGVSWSAGEDIALLNALKSFPKDVTMRWEKISAAVPGKSKAACVKRVAELKKGFRSLKASGEA